MPVPPVPINCTEYNMPAVAAGRELGEICNAAFTCSVNDCVVVAPSESVTVAVNETGPGAGGVPMSAPDALSANQEGKPAALHEYVPDPPVAVNWNVYGTPTIAGVGASVITGALSMGSVKVALVGWPGFGDAVTVNVIDPGAGGVPLN